MHTAVQHRAYRYQELEVEIPEGIKPGALQFAALVLLTLAAVIAFVWLTSQTETIEKNVTSLREQVATQRSEVENLRVVAERYRGGKYIAAAVRRFKLDLHPAYSGQVRRVSVDGRVQEEDYRNAIAALDSER